MSHAGSNMQHYEPGTRVEVIGQDDEYVNSYYAATVLLSHQNNVIVLYEQRLNPNGQLLEEEVDEDHIRPYPPDVDHYLNEGDNVDVLRRNGWWKKKVIFQRPNDLVVYFSEYPRNRRHVTYVRDDVRIHQEWFDNGRSSTWMHVKV